MNLPRRRSKVLVFHASFTFAVLSSAGAESGEAAAQVLFPPYGDAFHRPIVEPDPEVSPRRIAAILAREGYRLAGPLGRRGDQIVAIGVNPRGWRMQFIVDPYEGEILSSRPLEPALEYGDLRDGIAPQRRYGPADPIEPDEYGSQRGHASVEPYEPIDAAEGGIDGPGEAPYAVDKGPLAQPKTSSPRARTPISPTVSGHRAALHPPPVQKANTPSAPGGVAPSPPASPPTAQSNAPARTTALSSASPAPATNAQAQPVAPAPPGGTASAPARAGSPKAINEAGPKTNFDR